MPQNIRWYKEGKIFKNIDCSSNLIPIQRRKLGYYPVRLAVSLSLHSSLEMQKSSLMSLS